MRYVDNHGQITEAYPLNPNGSIQGVAGLCNGDEHFNIMMPYPERVIRTVQNSWAPDEWSAPEWNGDGAWMHMFHKLG